MSLGVAEFYRDFKRYPDSLTELFAHYTLPYGGQKLTSPLTDPETHEQYYYQSTSNGQDFELYAVMSSGKKYIQTQEGTFKE